MATVRLGRLVKVLSLLLCGMIVAPQLVRAQSSCSPDSPVVDFIETNCDGIYFHWQPVAGATAYKVYRWDTLTAAWVLIKSLTGSDRSHTVSETEPFMNTESITFAVTAEAASCPEPSLLAQVGPLEPKTAVTPGQCGVNQLPDGRTQVWWNPYDARNINARIYRDQEQQPIAEVSYGSVFVNFYETVCGSHTYSVKATGVGTCLSDAVTTDPVEAGGENPIYLITNPDGQTWLPGSQKQIRWDGIGPVDIELCANVDQGAFTKVQVGVMTSPVTITVPNWTTSRAKLRVTRAGCGVNTGTHAGLFRIHSAIASDWAKATAAVVGVGGEGCALALDDLGRPRIALRNGPTQNAKLIVRDRATWTVQAIDGSPASGYGSGFGMHLALDATNTPHITHNNYTTGSITYQTRSGSVWTSEVLGYAGLNGGQHDLIVAPNGDVHVCYLRDSDLWYRRRTAGAWNAEERVRLHEAGSPGGASGVSPRILLTASGAPRIAFIEIGAGPAQPSSVWLSTRTPDAVWSPQLVASQGGQSLAFAQDAAGDPWVSYIGPDAAVMVARKLGASSWVSEPVDQSPGTLGPSALGILPTGTPCVAYRANGVLKFAEKAGGSWLYSIVEASPDDAISTSLKVDPNGNVRLAWFDRANGLVRYATRAGDTTPPSAVSQILKTTGRTTIALTWYATGDDGNSGAPWAYELKQSATGPLNDASFLSAERAGIGTLGVQGGEACASLAGLPSCATRYFALRIIDDLGNESPATSVSATTLCSGWQEVYCAGSSGLSETTDAVDVPEQLEFAARGSAGTRGPWAVEYGIPEGHAGADLDVGVFDIGGRRLTTLVKGPATVGRHRVDWDATDDSGRHLAPGMYFVRLRIHDEQRVARAIVLRR